MNLTEALITLAIIGTAAALVVMPGKRIYSSYRADSYKIASSLRSCAIYSIGNNSCNTRITGKLLAVTCSGGYGKQEKLNRGVVGNYSFSCSEGFINNPSNVQVGQFLVETSRRSVNVIIKKQQGKGK